MNVVTGIYDNVLDFEERKTLFDLFFSEGKNVPSLWVTKEGIKNQPELEKLSKIIDKQIDTSDCSGYEMWTHNLTAPGFHYDKDEYMFVHHKVNIFPKCTLIYYLEIRNYDGNLHNLEVVLSTPDFIVVPKENRCVLMNSGIIHGSFAKDQVRRLIALSPWKEKPSQINEIIFN